MFGRPCLVRKEQRSMTILLSGLSIMIRKLMSERAVDLSLYTYLGILCVISLGLLEILENM